MIEKYTQSNPKTRSCFGYRFEEVFLRFQARFYLALTHANLCLPSAKHRFACITTFLDPLRFGTPAPPKWLPKCSKNDAKTDTQCTQKLVQKTIGENTPIFNPTGLPKRPKGTPKDATGRPEGAKREPENAKSRLFGAVVGRRGAPKPIDRKVTQNISKMEAKMLPKSTKSRPK